MKKVPVLAGVCATDPFRRMDFFLKQVESIGFHGVQNFPTVGLFDGNFRQNLEETGMGYRLVLVIYFVKTSSKPRRLGVSNCSLLFSFSAWRLL